MDQSLEVIGQLGRRRQTRAADEDRDQRDVAVQGPGQLQADMVIGFEQSRGALWGCRGLPARADHHQDGVAAVERPLPDRLVRPNQVFPDPSPPVRAPFRAGGVLARVWAAG
jgi:hypothetical protein